MIIFDYYTSENKTEHNLKWPYIPDHSHIILTTGVSGSRKLNALLSFVNKNQVLIKYMY